jgi:arsenate reductase
MAELGIDIRGHWSKHVDDFAGQPFDYVITVCDHANESCPVFPAQTRRIHWSFEDPHSLAEFRRIRDHISHRLTEFVDGLPNA